MPQNPGAKQPCVKWKPFQERLPSEKELKGLVPRSGRRRAWRSSSGPVSDLLVIDVDGTEAHHETLLRAAGRRACGPQSAVGQPQTQSLSPLLPLPGATPTKAKATPWHAKLEFRGRGGIVVLPPSSARVGPAVRLGGRTVAGRLGVARVARGDRYGTAGATIVTANCSAFDQRGSGKRQFQHAGFPGRQVPPAGPKWNERLFRAACDLAGRGMSQKEAEPLLLAGARPWDESNAEAARRTIESAFSRPRKPARH